MNLTQQQKYIIQIVGIVVLFYIVIFLVWNFTSPDSERPTGILWDSKKEGYKRDPLDDRYWNLRNQEGN